MSQEPTPSQPPLPERTTWNNELVGIIENIATECFALRHLHRRHQARLHILYRFLQGLTLITLVMLAAYETLDTGTDSVVKRVVTYIGTALQIINANTKLPALSADHKHAALGYHRIEDRVRGIVSLYRQNRPDAWTTVSSIMKQVRSAYTEEMLPPVRMQCTYLFSPSSIKIK